MTYSKDSHDQRTDAERKRYKRRMLRMKYQRALERHREFSILYDALGYIAAIIIGCTLPVLAWAILRIAP